MSCSETAGRRNMVIMNDAELSVKEQCELLGINRSTLYYKPKESQETAIEREEYIKSRIHGNQF